MNHIFARIAHVIRGGDFRSILNELDIRYIRNRWGRATARGQGVTTKFSKASPTGDHNVNGDMHDYPFIIPYLSSTYDAAGGPVIGDDMVTLNRSANPQAPDWVILGKLSSTKFDLDGAPFVFDASITHAGAPPDQDLGSQIKIFGMYTDQVGDNVAWAIGVKGGIGSDHWLMGRGDMHTGDGFDEVFAIYPFPIWNTQVGMQNDFPNYQGPGVNVEIDGRMNISASILAGKYSSSVGANRRDTLGAPKVNGLMSYQFGGDVYLGHDAKDTVYVNGVLSLVGGTTGNLPLSDGGNLSLGTTTGTKIGTSTTQKLGFYNKAPIAQQANTAGAVTAGATYTAQEQSMLNDCYSVLRNLGLLS